MPGGHCEKLVKVGRFFTGLSSFYIVVFLVITGCYGYLRVVGAGGVFSPDFSSVEVASASKFFAVNYSGLCLLQKILQKMALHGLTFGEHFVKITPAKDKNYLLGIIKYFKIVTKCS